MTLGQAGAVLAGRYQLVRLVGTAIDGEVWQGHDQRLARSVTVRLAAADPDAPADDPGVQPLITRLSQVNDPGVAAVYDVGVDDGLRYAVGEWIHGRTLGQIFATGRQPWQRAGDWGQQVGAALASLHEAGIVHGTLTAESIAIQDDRRAKIIDLGLVARAAEDDEGERDGDRAGDRSSPGADEDNRKTMVVRPALGGPENELTTALPHAERTEALPPAARPEVPAEAADDVYALGAVLWWAVTGVPLAYATTTSAGPDPAPLREAGAPAEFIALLLRMLDGDPAARPAAAAAGEQFAAVQALPRPDDTMVGPGLIAPTQAIAQVNPTQAIAQVPDYDQDYAPDYDRDLPRRSDRGSDRRRIWAIVGGVLALVAAGVLIGVLLANRSPSAPAVTDTNTPTPGSQTTSAPVTLPSAPTPTATTATASPTPTATSASPTPTPTPTTPSPTATTTSASPTPSSTTTSPSAGGSPTVPGGINLPPLANALQ